MKKTVTLVLILFNAFLWMGCTMKHQAELILFNGKIYSVDKNNNCFEAMAVAQGKIMGTGTSSTILKKYAGVPSIDLGGKTVYPGFIDAHCHFLGYAMNQQFVDLNGCHSLDEVLERLKSRLPLHPGAWLTGRGWDQNLWAVREFPGKAQLDQLFPKNPVVLIRVDGHSVLCNQEALNRSGIGFSHAFKRGEVGVRNGQLTGILSETAADSMRARIPLPVPSQQQALILQAQQKCFAVGLCMVSDAGIDAGEVELIRSLQESGMLHLRVYAMLNPTPENMKVYIGKGPLLTDKLFVRSIKLYADGSLGSRTALLKKPYTDDPLISGIRVIEPDSARTICALALQNGYQVNTHCIGDSAVRLMLEIYAGLLKGKNELRWRIEHAQVVDPADFHWFGDYSIIPSVQATHATSDMNWAIERLGAGRLKGAYAYKTLLQQNGWLPNGTDFPIENISPLLTFYAAIARQDLDGLPPTGFMAENALTREEALRSITIWAAKAGFSEKENGSLEPGKNADFVILDGDIMTLPLAAIPSVKVIATYIDGVKVH